MSSLRFSTRIVFIAGIMSAVILAFGFRTEATGFTYATGDGFNLKIDSRSIYNGVLQPNSTWSLKNLTPSSDKFFNFNDVKPGDRGTTTISFHVNKDAWICLDFEKLKEKENGRNEPEMLVDASGGANSGELADGTEFFAWFDDGDNSFEIGEKAVFGTSTGKQAATKVFDSKTYALADSLTGFPLVASTTWYVGITWCAGDLSVNLATAGIVCDATALGNEAQTDSFTVDVSIRASASKDNKKFRCTKQGTTCEYSCTGNCGGPVNVNVTNNGTIINTTTSSSNTGGNSAGSGGTVITGNATSNASTTNIVNTVNILINRLRGR